MEEATCKKCPDAAPGWVMTFADLMSLLLAFFVLLFSFSELDKQKYKRIAGSMREAFGVQKVVRVKEPPKGVNIIAREFSPGRPDPTLINTVRQFTIDDLKKNLRIDEYLELLKRRIERDKVVFKSKLAREIKEGRVEIDVEDRKIVLRIREQGVFESGRADIMPEFEPVLERIREALRETGGGDLVVVSGHTDDRPIHTGMFRSNWDLSAERAVSVAHRLMEDGVLPPDHFRIEGYADTRPRADNTTPEGRAQNRRVEIAVVYGRDEEIARALLAYTRAVEQGRGDDPGERDPAGKRESIHDFEAEVRP